MLRSKLAALAIAVAAMIAAMPGAKAGEIEQASATLNAIDRDMGAARSHAEYNYEQMNRAQMALQWHARMERVRGAQMTRSGCAQPRSEQVWHYCAGLYRDLQEHARARQYWINVAEASRANHVAAVNHMDQLNQAGYAWKTHLAMLQGQSTVLADLD